MNFVILFVLVVCTLGISMLIIGLTVWFSLRGTFAAHGNYKDIQQALNALIHRGLVHQEDHVAVYTAAPVELQLRVTPKGKHSTFALHGHVSIILPKTGRDIEPQAVEHVSQIVFRHERRKDRLGKTLKLNREFQSQDSVFDDRVYIESNCTDDVLTSILSRASIRQAIMTILESGYTEVILFDERSYDISIKAENPTPGLLEPEALKHVADAVHVLARDVPELHSLRVNGPSSGIIPSILVSILLLALSVFGLTVKSWSTLGFELMLLAIPVFWVLMVINGLWSWWRFRQRSTGLRSFANWMAWSAVLLTIAAYPITDFLNILPDTSKETVETTILYRTHLRGGPKTQPLCNIHIKLPNQASKSIIKLSCKDYNKYHKGQRIKVDMHKGALGVPWVNNIRPLDAQ